MALRYTGGPAFPRQHTIADADSPFFKYGSSGMSLRDWFAGMALQGIVSNYVKRLDAGDSDADRWAEECYCIADAMIAERDK